VCVSLGVVWAGPAVAATFDDGYGNDPTQPLGYAFETVAPVPKEGRAFEIEVGVRLRMVNIPPSLLDVWYYDEDDEGWAYIEGRPPVRGHGIGLETVVKGDNSNGIFYVEYIDSDLEAGYWDDIENPPDHLDGDFLAPSPAQGMVTFGANYAYEIHVLKIAATEGRFGLSFLAGGGLGLGVLTGSMSLWSPDSDGNPSYKRYLDGLPPDSDKEIPRVYPMVDMNASLRLNFGDRVVLRLEGGLHSMLYYGTALGVVL
jgi:hypothetical protein